MFLGLLDQTPTEAKDVAKLVCGDADVDFAVHTRILIRLLVVAPPFVPMSAHVREVVHLLQITPADYTGREL